MPSRSNSNIGDDEMLIDYEDDEENNDRVPSQDTSKICGLKESTHRIVFGVVLVIIIAISWTGSTQFAKSSYKDKSFSAPFFTTWFAEMFMSLLYPLYMLSLICQKRSNVKVFFRKTFKIIGPNGITKRLFMVFLFKVFSCTLMIVVINFFYLKSLEYLLPSTVSAIFSSQSAFVYVLSIIFLGETVLLLRILSLFLSVGGIVLMSYSEGFGASSLYGILFVCIAAVATAIYQVSFKKIMGSASGSQVAFLFSIIGIMNAVLFWPIIFLFEYLKIEDLQWTNLPWEALIGTALLGLIFSYCVNFGIVFTYPLFISIGTFIGVPLNAILDTIIRDKDFGLYKIIATIMILTGFCMLLIPVEPVKRVEQKLFCCKKRQEEFN